MSTTKPMTWGGVRHLTPPDPDAEHVAQVTVYTATGQARVIELTAFMLAQLVRDSAAALAEVEFARLEGRR